MFLARLNYRLNVFFIVRGSADSRFLAGVRGITNTSFPIYSLTTDEFNIFNNVNIRVGIGFNGRLNARGQHFSILINRLNYDA